MDYICLNSIVVSPIRIVSPDFSVQALPLGIGTLFTYTGLSFLADVI